MLLGLPEIVVYCMAIQLSGERPRALERRSAISGLIRLVPVRMRFSVEAVAQIVLLQIDLRNELAEMGRIVHRHELVDLQSEHNAIITGVSMKTVRL